jgi:pyruvate/2-oxoglutarate dehydrogenase complex dihydrolipoamide acyltransferase (E2) component
VVPVLRDCDHLSFADVEKRLSELSVKARKDEITLEEMAGGTPPRSFNRPFSPIYAFICARSHSRLSQQQRACARVLPDEVVGAHDHLDFGGGGVFQALSRSPTVAFMVR